MEPPARAVADRPSGRPPALAARIPITILAGFLGSGKTTLVNRILSGDHGLRVAVLVNDFGAVNVDARLIVSRAATMIELDNGCICCSVSADLVSQLVGLLEGPSPPDRVLVETSGVSDPGRLLVALRDPHLRALARVDGVITLVDAAGVEDIPPALQELARRQLAAADVIVFTKTDLVAAGDVVRLRRRLTYPQARVLEGANGDLPLEILLGIDSPGPQDGSADEMPAGGDHSALFSTWTWTSTRPLDYAAIRRLLASLPPAVYRVKGFLHLADVPETRVVAHVVGRRVDLRPLGAWDGRRPQSELVFVCLEPELDAIVLRRRLAAAAAPVATAGSPPLLDAERSRGSGGGEE